MKTRGGRRLLQALVLLLLPSLLLAEQSSPPPTIAIIIDDMGNRGDWGQAILALPGKVTYAFLPYTPHAKRLAQLAHDQGKEVMLHLPMESHLDIPLGPGALTLHMTEVLFKQTVLSDLQAIPHAKGLNNHMGSLLTRHPGAMRWVMESMQQHGDLFFIDSRTSLQTVGQQVAEELQIPNARRDVFLDNVRDPELIKKQFRQLIRQAKRRGFAIGIGHPYPETTEVLAQLLGELGDSGVKLIAASEMIEFQKQANTQTTPLSSTEKLAKRLNKAGY